MKIDDKTMDVVAALAKLELSEEGALTRESARMDLEKILAYMKVMEELDTEDIEPMSHVLPLKNVFREDVVQPAECTAEEGKAPNPAEKLAREGQFAEKEQPAGEEQTEAIYKKRKELLDNAPVQKNGCFVVPKTVE